MTTWPAGAQRLFALREFCLAGDGGELGRATTGWMVINVATRRPVRVPEDVETIGRSTPPRVLADEFAKLPELERADFERAIEVRYADLDMNGHANNVSVIAWALEALPGEIALGSALSELEVDFRAEALHGDRIVARAQREDGDAPTFRHALVREGDGREIARLRSVWSAGAR